MHCWQSKLFPPPVLRGTCRRGAWHGSVIARAWSHDNHTHGFVRTPNNASRMRGNWKQGFRGANPNFVGPEAYTMLGGGALFMEKTQNYEYKSRYEGEYLFQGLCKWATVSFTANQHVNCKGGYTLVTLPRTVTPHRDSVDGTRGRVTYQKLVTRWRYGHVHVHTCSGRNRIIPLMRRPNTDSTPNKPVTSPRNQLLIRYAVTSPVHTVTIRCYDTR